MSKANYLFGTKGHVGELNRHFKADARQREAAERAKKSIILTPEQLRGGRWGVTKTLITTLGGVSREITAADLETFRRNKETVEKRFPGTGGITARDVINLAEHNPLKYAQGHGSDIFKARTEINKAAAVSAMKDEVRFITNASGESGANYHHVLIKFRGYNLALSGLISTPAGDDDEKYAMDAADKLRKGLLAFDCDCGRHRYFLRYVATIGGFNAGRDERGFPKIRNPGLKGVACKHVLRVMAEIEKSRPFLQFLARHLLKTTKQNQSSRRTMAKKEERKRSHDKKPVAIKSDNPKVLGAQKKEREALQAAVNAKKPPRQTKGAASSRKLEALIAHMKKEGRAKEEIHAEVDKIFQS